MPTSGFLAEEFPVSFPQPAGGFYGTTANWDPIGVPSAADYAEFEISGAYTVSFDGDYTASYMDFGRGRVAFDLRGYTYDLTNV